KSRLLSEFRREAVLAGVETIQVQCPEIASAPLHPFNLVMRALAPSAGSSTATETERGAAHRRLASLLQGEAGVDEDREAPERRIAREKSRVFDQLTGYLLGCASAAPLVLIFEDVHWADGPSLELLSSLARNARGSRLLLVA